MAHRLIWSTRARNELKSITEYIKRDSKVNARTVVTKLTKEVRRVQEFPFSGRVVPEWQNAAFREVIVHNFRVVYKLGADTVAILAILHSRKRFPKRPPRMT